MCLLNSKVATREEYIIVVFYNYEIIIIIIIITIMCDTELLKHSKLNCGVRWTIIASGPPNFIMIVC